MSVTKRIGKSTLSIKARGCHDCGTQYSFSWATFKVIDVQVAGRVYQVEIPICGSCLKKRGYRGDLVPAGVFC